MTAPSPKQSSLSLAVKVKPEVGTRHRKGEGHRKNVRSQQSVAMMIKPIYPHRCTHTGLVFCPSILGMNTALKRQFSPK